MAKKVLKYKDVTVGYGSNLYNALEAGDMKLAEKLYRESEAEFVKIYGKHWKGPDVKTLNSSVVVNGWGPLDANTE